jgi:hypothetical protein
VNTEQQRTAVIVIVVVVAIWATVFLADGG